jgi:hypothetical protein
LKRGTGDRTNKASNQRDEKREESVTERDVMAWVLDLAQHACKIGHANVLAYLQALGEAQTKPFPRLKYEAHFGIPLKEVLGLER